MRQDLHDDSALLVPARKQATTVVTVGHVRTKEEDTGLKARNLADRTLRAYGDNLTALVDHTDATQLGDLDRDAIREFFADLTGRYAPATVCVRYRVAARLRAHGRRFISTSCTQQGAVNRAALA